MAAVGLERSAHGERGEQGAPGPSPSARATTATKKRTLPKWLRVSVLALLPAAAILELALGAYQRAHVPKHDDWGAAATAAIAAKTQPGDEIIVTPRWAEEMGAMALSHFVVPREGKPFDVAYDVHQAARADLETANRVIELSIRGKDDPQTKGWPLVSQQRFGDVAVRILQNPRPQKLVRDLSDEADVTAKVTRSQPNGAVDVCRWEQGAMNEMPNLFQGPETPSNRFVCPPGDASWSFVGTTVITDLEYVPRRCIYFDPDGPSTNAIEFPPKPIAHRLVGYVGLHVYSERTMDKTPMDVRVSIAGQPVASVTHHDGDGWLRFEAKTDALAGQSLPVKIEVWADDRNSVNRPTCVEVQLRD